MSWTDRERAMLAEMGVQLPPPTAQPTVSPAVLAPASPAIAVSVPSAVSPAAATSAPGRQIPPEADPPMVLAEPLRHETTAWDKVAWDALPEAVSGCQACGLCASRTNAVTGVGSPSARLMIVGEAPGEQEDRRGEPFVGPAGQLLDRMLQAIGAGRDGRTPVSHPVFITNTIKCRPPGNRNPQAEELAACAPILRRQIREVQPKVILAMGRFAAQSLLQSDLAIGRLRGQVHPLPMLPTVQVVATYHPAYLLRNPIDKAKAWEDLCRAVELLER